MQKTMTTFRKTLLPLLLVAMAFALTSCGKTYNGENLVENLQNDRKLSPNRQVDLITLKETKNEAAYITLEKDGERWTNASLVTLKSGQLSEFKKIEAIDGKVIEYKDCKINGKTYWHFYVTNNQGNGTSLFFDVAKSEITHQINGTVDKYHEGYLYPETAKRFDIDYNKIKAKEKYSAVYLGGKLESYIKDMNGDGYEDLVFYGAEILLDDNNVLLGQRKVENIYHYDPTIEEYNLFQKKPSR